MLSAELGIEFRLRLGPTAKAAGKGVVDEVRAGDVPGAHHSAKGSER